ncbi:hypothetical protein [Vibrio sp. B1FLJ16]|nr:hypothetical protein [Vibrio sp. B1FLJ16]
MGEVSSTTVTYAPTESAELTVSTYNELSGMEGASGITTVAQSSGSNALIQQAVSTNANLFTE